MLLFFVGALFAPTVQINKLMSTEISPQIPMAMELMAPWISPISRALDVPSAWLQAPVARPWATASVIPNHLENSGTHKAPVRPAIITQAAAMPATPPWLSAMLIAMGVVQLLGMMEAVTAASTPSTRHNVKTLIMLVALPAVAVFLWWC